MRVPILVALTLVFLGGGAALGLDLVVQTDEEQVEEILHDIVDARDAGRAGAFARHVSLEAHALVISAPGIEHIYDAADEAPLLDLLAHVQDELRGSEISVVQSSIEVRGDTVRATLNVEASRDGERSYLPMDVTLRRLGDGFVVTRLRVHH